MVIALPPTWTNMEDALIERYSIYDLRNGNMSTNIAHLFCGIYTVKHGNFANLGVRLQTKRHGCKMNNALQVLYSNM